MSSKRTPGPWTAVADTKNYGDQLFILGDDGRVLVAEMNHTHRHISRAPEDVDADACLIAAAPSLLHACRRAYQMCDFLVRADELGPEDGVTILRDVCAAALDKAEETTR